MGFFLASVIYLGVLSFKRQKKGEKFGDMFKEVFVVEEKFSYQRVVLGLVAGGLDVLMVWTFTEGYAYAALANLNQGVLMSTYSTVPIIMGLTFWICFGQKCAKHELIGIVFCAGAIVIVAFSKHTGGGAGSISPVGPILLLLLSIFIMCVRNVVVKYELGRTQQEHLADVYQNCYSLVYGLIFLIISIWYFRKHGFNATDYFFYGLLGGAIGNVSEVIGVYANVWGVAGPVSALIETCPLM